MTDPRPRGRPPLEPGEPTRSVTFDLPDSLHRRLVREAKRRATTMAALAREVFDAALPGKRRAPVTRRPPDP